MLKIINESKREEAAVQSHLRVLLQHMLKCQFQYDYPDKKSWRLSILQSHSSMLDEFIEIGKGSLYKKFYMNKMPFTRIYQQARRLAATETGLPMSTFPIESPWSREQLIDENFVDDFIIEYGQDNLAIL